MSLDGMRGGDGFPPDTQPGVVTDPALETPGRNLDAEAEMQWERIQANWVGNRGAREPMLAKLNKLNAERGAALLSVEDVEAIFSKTPSSPTSATPQPELEEIRSLGAASPDDFPSGPPEHVEVPLAPDQPATPTPVETPSEPTAVSVPDTTAAQPRWKVPGQARGGKSERRRALSEPERATVAVSYIELLSRIEEKITSLRPKYEFLLPAVREKRLREDPEVQLLLVELDRVKDQLTASGGPTREVDGDASQPERVEKTLPVAAQEVPLTPVGPSPVEPGVIAYQSHPGLEFMDDAELQAMPRTPSFSETHSTPGPIAAGPKIELTEAVAPKAEIPTLTAPEPEPARLPRTETMVPLAPEPETSVVPTPAPERAPVVEPVAEPIVPVVRPVVSAADFNPEVAPPPDAAKQEIPAGFNPEEAPPAEKPFNPEEAPPAEPRPETVLPAAPEMVLRARELLEQRRAAEATALVEARGARAKAIRREGNWFNKGNKHVLVQTETEYGKRLRSARDAGLAEVKKSFAGRDLTKPAVQAELDAELLRFAVDFKHSEDEAVRTALLGDQEKGKFEQAVDKFRQFWRRNGKFRMVANVSLLGLGGFGALTGQLWMTGMAAGARGALTGLATGDLTESGLRTASKAWGRKFGASRELSPEQLEEITDAGELREMIAAHTVDALEYGDTFGARKAGFRGKKVDTTGARLVERLGAVEREAREAKVEVWKKEGLTREQIVERFLELTLEDHAALNQDYVNRLHANKNFSKARVATATAAGLLSGLWATEATEHLSKSKMAGWLKNVLGGHGPETAAHPGGVIGDVAHGLSGTPAVEHGAMAAAEHGATAAAEVAHPGDSVWTLAERYVDQVAPHLSPEQKTWMVDSLKDAVVKQPGLFGLHDAAHLAEGQAIDFTKSGISIPGLVTKATKLSAATLSSIHEHLANAHEVAQAGAEPLATTMAAADVSHVSSGVAADTLAHATHVADVAPATTEVATQASSASPEVVSNVVAGAYAEYQGLTLKLPEAAMQALGRAFENVSVADAAQPGAIERIVSQSWVGGTSAIERQQFVTTIHGLAKKALAQGFDGGASLEKCLEWIRLNR